MWGYYWGFTSAQIELLVVDSPIIVYNHKSKGKKGKGEFSKVDPNKVNAKVKEWEDKYSNRNESVSLNLDGFA